MRRKWLVLTMEPGGGNAALGIDVAGGAPPEDAIGMATNTKYNS